MVFLLCLVLQLQVSSSLNNNCDFQYGDLLYIKHASLSINVIKFFKKGVARICESLDDVVSPRPPPNTGILDAPLFRMTAKYWHGTNWNKFVARLKANKTKGSQYLWLRSFKNIFALSPGQTLATFHYTTLDIHVE